MIARIHFEGIVKIGKKKSILPDYIDIHTCPNGLGSARAIFESWLSTGWALRGNSGVFHLLGTNGEIKIKKVEEGE